MRKPSSDLRVVRAAVGIAVLLASRGSHAEEPRTSSLSWVRLEGAESCLTAATLAEAVEARLGRKVFVSASEADLNLEGSIGVREDLPGFRATLRVTDRDGAALGFREVETESSDCASIDEQLALVVSLLIDPDAALTTPPEPPPEPPPPAPAPTPVKPPPSPAPVVRERVVVVSAPPREPWRLALSAGMMTTVGLQPGFGVGVAPALVLEVPGPIGVLVEGGIALPSTVEAEAEASADASYAHAGLAICPLVAHPGRWSALACAGWLLGVLSADGGGFDMDQSGAALATGPWIEARLELSIVGPLVATTSLGAAMPVRRAEIGYRTPAGRRSLYETAPVAGLGDLGLGLRFP